MGIVNYCQTLFGYELPSTLLKQAISEIHCCAVMSGLSCFIFLLRLVKLLLC